MQSKGSRLILTICLAACLLAGIGAAGRDADARGSAVVTRTAAGSLQVISHIGGQMTAVRGAAGRVYMAMGAELLVFDATEAEGALTPMGRLTLPGPIEALDVAGDLVAAAVGQAGVRLIRAAGAAQPLEIGAYAPASFSAQDVRIDHGKVYVAAGTAGLVVLTISDQGAVADVRAADTPGFARGVDVLGAWAAVADGESGGLRVFSMAGGTPTPAGGCDTPGKALRVLLRADAAGQPAAAYVADGEAGVTVVGGVVSGTPQIARTADTPGYAHETARSGDFLYVADGHGGVRVLLAVDALRPAEVGRLDAHGPATAVDADAARAYVCADGLRIYSLTQDGPPVRVASFVTTGLPQTLFVQEGLAYVADEAGGVQIWDVSNPAAPIRRGGLMGVTRGGKDIDVVGPYATVADGWNGYWVVNVANPAAPATAVRVGANGGIGDVGAMDVRDQRAYFLSEGQPRALWIYDTHTPAQPRQLGYWVAPWNLPWGVSLYELDARGDYVYLTSQVGVHAVRVSDPAQPAQTDFADRPQRARGVRAYGEYLYVSAGDTMNATNWIEVFDLSDPGRLVSVRRQPYSISNGDLFAADGRLYLTYDYFGEPGQLVVFSLEDPTYPQIVGRAFLTDPKRCIDVDKALVGRVFAAGDYVYAPYAPPRDQAKPNSEKGILVFTVSGRASPAEIAHFDAPGPAFGLDRVGQTAYIADGRGMARVALDDPTQPAYLPGYVLPGGTFPMDSSPKVKARAGMAYLTAGVNGLRSITVTTGITVTGIISPAGVYDPLTGNGPDLALPASETVTDTVYLANGVSNVEMIRVSPVYRPSLVTQYRYVQYDALALDQAGSDLYAGCSSRGATPGALEIVRINGQALGLVGRLDLPGPARDVDVVGTRVLAAVDAASAPGLTVVDVATPNAPRVAGALTLSSVNAVKADEARGRAYIAGRTVWAVASYTSTTPALLAQTDLPAMAHDLLVMEDGTLLVAAGNAGLFVLRYNETLPSPTPSATASSALTATASPTLPASATPTSTATATITETATATPPSSATPTETATPTATASPTPTSTENPTATETATPSSTPSPTASATASATPSETPASTPTPTPGSTPSPTATPTETPTVWAGSYRLLLPLTLKVGVW